MPIAVLKSAVTLKKVAASILEDLDDGLGDQVVDDLEVDEGDLPDELLDNELSADFVAVDEDDDEFEPSDQDTKSFNFYQLVSAFFQVCPEPTDQQVHSLAEACGMSAEAFEAEMYKVINVMLSDDDSEPELKSMLTKLVKSGVQEFNPAEGELDGEPDLETLQ